MKTRYRIGLFIFSIVIIYLSSNIIYKDENDSVSNAEESVTTDGHALNKECYYLYEINGFVVVFLSDRKTPYEYTNIMFSDLPDIIQNEIKNGKYIGSDEELYGFLENYSS